VVRTDFAFMMFLRGRLDLRRQVKIVPGIEKVVSQIIECDAVELIGAGTEKGAWEFDGLESQRA